MFVIERPIYFSIYIHLQFSFFNSEVGDIRLVSNMKGLLFSQQGFLICDYRIPSYSRQTGVCVRHQSFSTREDML